MGLPKLPSSGGTNPMDDISSHILHMVRIKRTGELGPTDGAAALGRTYVLR